MSAARSGGETPEGTYLCFVRSEKVGDDFDQSFPGLLVLALGGTRQIGKHHRKCVHGCSRVTQGGEQAIGKHNGGVLKEAQG